MHRSKQYARRSTSPRDTTPILCTSFVPPFYKAAIPANTPIAPRAKPARVAWAAAPVEVLDPLVAEEAPEEAPEEAAEEAAEAVAEVEPEDTATPVASAVDWLALPALVKTAAVTPVLFWQSALYSAEVKGVEVKVMSAHCKHCQQCNYTPLPLERFLTL